MAERKANQLNCNLGRSSEAKRPVVIHSPNQSTELSSLSPQNKTAKKDKKQKLHYEGEQEGLPIRSLHSVQRVLSGRPSPSPKTVPPIQSVSPGRSSMSPITVSPNRMAVPPIRSLSPGNNIVLHSKAPSPGMNVALHSKLPPSMQDVFSTRSVSPARQSGGDIVVPRSISSRIASPGRTTATTKTVSPVIGCDSAFLTKWNPQPMPPSQLRASVVSPAALSRTPVSSSSTRTHSPPQLVFVKTSPPSVGISTISTTGRISPVPFQLQVHVPSPGPVIKQEQNSPGQMQHTIEKFPAKLQTDKQPGHLPPPSGLLLSIAKSQPATAPFSQQDESLPGHTMQAPSTGISHPGSLYTISSILHTSEKKTSTSTVASYPTLSNPQLIYSPTSTASNSTSDLPTVRNILGTPIVSSISSSHMPSPMVRIVTPPMAVPSQSHKLVISGIPDRPPSAGWEKPQVMSAAQISRGDKYQKGPSLVSRPNQAVSPVIVKYENVKEIDTAAQLQYSTCSGHPETRTAPPPAHLGSRQETSNGTEYLRTAASTVMPHTLNSKLDQTTAVTTVKPGRKDLSPLPAHRQTVAVPSGLGTSFPSKLPATMLYGIPPYQQPVNLVKVSPKDDKTEVSKSKLLDINPFLPQPHPSIAGPLPPFQTLQQHPQPILASRLLPHLSRFPLSTSHSSISLSDVTSATTSLALQSVPAVSLTTLVSSQDSTQQLGAHLFKSISEPVAASSVRYMMATDASEDMPMLIPEVPLKLSEGLTKEKENSSPQQKKTECSSPDKELEAIPHPFSMRLQILNNFPLTNAYKSTYRSNPVSRVKSGCITNTAKSLDLLRQNLQKNINKEIDEIIQRYLEKFFKPGIENVKFNCGASSVNDEHVHSVCRQILDEAKKMYPSEPRCSSTPLRDIPDNVSESGSTSGRRGYPYRKRRPSDTDSDISLPIPKRKKKGRPPLHISGRSTPSKTIKPNEPVKREGPKWDPERLTEDSLFVMGARANKALGFGATRGRLYMKHPEIFKYSGDQDDKQWLFDHHHMPAIGGKAYILLFEDIQDLADMDEYRDSPNVVLSELVYFRVPKSMVEKMKAQMFSMRTDIPKTKTYHSKQRATTDLQLLKQHFEWSCCVNCEQCPGMSILLEAFSKLLNAQGLCYVEVKVPKLPFSRFIDEQDADEKTKQGSPANTDDMEATSVENEEQATDMSPFVQGAIEDDPSPTTSDLDGLEDDTTISTPFQLSNQRHSTPE